MPADFCPKKPQLDLPDQTPNTNIRLMGALRTPEGRTLLNPPTIKLSELFDQPASIPKGKRMPSMFRESVTRSTGSTVSAHEPFYIPSMSAMPSLNIPKKTSEGKLFLDDPLDQFRPLPEEHENLRKSNLPPLPHWERNLESPPVTEKNKTFTASAPKDFSSLDRFDDVDAFLARKKGIVPPNVEYVAEQEAGPVTVLKRVAAPAVRSPREAVFRRKRSDFIYKTEMTVEKVPPETLVPQAEVIPNPAEISPQQLYTQPNDLQNRAGNGLTEGDISKKMSDQVQSPMKSIVYSESSDSAVEFLRTVNLTKSYYKKKLKIPVLKGVNLSIQTGEFVSIIGQSGSGKSTLLHLLGALDIPESGEIYFENNRIDNLSNSKRDFLRNKSIGFIFQFYHLLPELTTLENVLSPLMIRSSVFKYYFQRKEYAELAKELLAKVGLSHRLKHKPCELSGGEMQRAAIARALISEPKILLADEPTGNLDAASATEIIELLQEIKTERKLTILMVTHDNQIAAAADRKVRMVDGVIDN